MSLKPRSKRKPRSSPRTRGIAPRPSSKNSLDQIIDALVKVKASPFWISLIYLGESIKEAVRAQQGPLTLLAGGIVMYLLQQLNGRL